MDQESKVLLEPLAPGGKTERDPSKDFTIAFLPDGPCCSHKDLHEHRTPPVPLGRVDYVEAVATVFDSNAHRLPALFTKGA